MLYTLGGLPGVAKSSLGRELARRGGAVYLRIDTIEWALAEAGHTGNDDPNGYIVQELAASARAWLRSRRSARSWSRPSTFCLLIFDHLARRGHFVA